MNAQNLFVMKFRRGSVGVETSFIAASSAAKAEEVAHKWCNTHPNVRLIRVDPAIAADESILDKETDDLDRPTASKTQIPVGAGKK